MKTWKNSPQKLFIIHNQFFFPVLAWLPKRPILGRNRNLIGSPCLLSTISLYLRDKTAKFGLTKELLRIGSLYGRLYHMFYGCWIFSRVWKVFLTQSQDDLVLPITTRGQTCSWYCFRPSSIYSWSIGHILEPEFFCLGCLGSSGSKKKKVDLSFSEQLLRVFF